MPPKVKITKKEIVRAALALVREQGAEALCARSVAGALGCSTQPVFSNFSSMEALAQATVRAAYEVYLGFLKDEVTLGKYPKYKCFGMAYIRFAREEKELFKLLFLRDRKGEELTPSADFSASVEMIMEANGIPRATAERMHLEIWTCVHGIGTMLVTSFLPLDEALISEMLTDIYQGVRARHLQELGR